MDSIHHYHSLLSHTTTNNVMPYPSPTAFTTSCLLISCAHLASSLASISPCNASLLPPPNNHTRQNVNNQHHACRDSVTLLYQLHRLNSACHCYHQTTSFPTRSSKPTIQNGQRRARTPTDPDLPLAHLLVQHRRLHRHHPQTLRRGLDQLRKKHVPPLRPPRQGPRRRQGPRGSMGDVPARACTAHETPRWSAAALGCILSYLNFAVVGGECKCKRQWRSQCGSGWPASCAFRGAFIAPLG